MPINIEYKNKLSVALCTYNGEKYIEQQLLSIINQILPVDEIIICDDQSEDKTCNIINNIINNHKGIKTDIKFFINKQRLGVIKNFEKAINLCTGNIIFISDQDDIWNKSKTQTITNHFNEHPNIELVFTNATIIDKNGYPIKKATLFNILGFNDNIQKLWKKGMYLEIQSLHNRITGATLALKKTNLNSIIKFSTLNNSLHDEQLAIKSHKQ